jgi:hypothetical protein
LLGQRVAAMRARRSSNSASGISIVNGRIAAAPAELWPLAMVVLLMEMVVMTSLDRSTALRARGGFPGLIAER